MNLPPIDKYGAILYSAPDSGSHEKLCGETLYSQIDRLRLLFGWCDFIQINSLLNQSMARLALEWLGIQPNDRVLDLFCGGA